jgi:hypothetical protein
VWPGPGCDKHAANEVNKPLGCFILTQRTPPTIEPRYFGHKELPTIEPRYFGHKELPTMKPRCF